MTLWFAAIVVSVERAKNTQKTEIKTRKQRRDIMDSPPP
jgi:hypothetical protein